MRHDRSARVPAPRRLFTALFADAPARAAIDAARQGWSGLLARLRPLPERMHVTLQFFNAVDAGRERAWRAALAELRFAPFDLALTRAELWHAPRGTIAVLRPAPIGWRVQAVDLVWSDLQAQPPRYHRLATFAAR